MSSKKVFFISSHQNKSNALAEALVAAGWRQAVTPFEPGVKVALYDHDVGPGGMGFRHPLEELHKRGIPVLFYPHAARPNLQWDGMYPVWPHPRVMFVVTETHAEIMKRYGYPIPTEPIGWFLCEQSPFHVVEPKGKIKVLFAPIHPNGNGFLHPMDKTMNANVFQTLLATSGIDLKVRHVKRIDLNGLWKSPNVGYKLGKTRIDDSLEDIRKADVVIGHQTLAYMAVAMGKPLIMFGDQAIPRSGNHLNNMRFAKNYEKYRELMRYPYEAENARTGQEMEEMIRKVIGRDRGKQWREKMIGKPLDRERFVELVEEYCS